jgi:hypothetical protein
MPAKKPKVAVVEDGSVTEAPAVENPVQAAFRRVSALLKQRSKLEAKRAEVAALESQLARLREENSALERQLKDGEKALRAEIPEVSVILDAGAPKSGGSTGTERPRGRGRTAKGGKLAPDQVDKVLAALSEPFGANDFSAKAEELFPGLVNVPIKKLAAGKITQVPGTASRGTKYTRA